MEKQEVRKLLKELAEIAEVKGIKLEFREMRKKLASASLNKKIIRLNKTVLILPDELIRYILAHEIAHIKLKTRYHSKEFREILTQLIGNDIEKLERKLIEFII